MLQSLKHYGVLVQKIYDLDRLIPLHNFSPGVLVYFFGHFFTFTQFLNVLIFKTLLQRLQLFLDRWSFLNWLFMNENASTKRVVISAGRSQRVERIHV